MLASARRRDRDQLRSRVSSARDARGHTNQRAYERAVNLFRRAHAVDRPTFYENYKGAMASAETASETIMKAALEAGAQDPAIVAYVTDDFFTSVNSFMLSSFGNGPDAGQQARRRDELQNLEVNTKVQSQTISRRVQVLRDELERANPSSFGRLLYWGGEHNPVSWVADTTATLWSTLRRALSR
jgi:hypothetical protein